MTVLPFNGSICDLHLGMPVGDRIRAQGNFYSEHTLAEIAWLPDERLASEVEMRMNVISANPPAGKAPVIRYKIEYGHGDSTVTLPPQINTSFVASDVILAKIFHLLPSRGRVMRLSARQIRIKIALVGTHDGTAWPTPQALVQISFNPCSGMHVPSAANEESLLTVAADPMHFASWPSDANEFRLRRENGTPFPAATATMVFGGLNSYLNGGNDAANYSDWSPIPAFSQWWSVGAGAGVSVLAQYR